MRKVKKIIEYGNFNCTFGDKFLPLLSNLSNIVVPALKSGIIIREKDDLSYSIDNVSLFKHNYYGYCLQGRFIKNTYLEVLSKQDEENRLIHTNEIYPTSPYSLFVIFLKNHKMVFVKNQKGSPTMMNLERIVMKLIVGYAKKRKIVNTDTDDFSVDLHITPLPSQTSLAEQLEEIVSVTNVKFNLFPLNGGCDFKGILDSLQNEMSNSASKQISVSISKPKNIPWVNEQIMSVKGNGKFVLKGKKINGSEVKITENNFSEKAYACCDSSVTDEELINNILEMSNTREIYDIYEGEKERYESFLYKIGNDDNRG